MNDIDGARKVEMKGILVKTGKQYFVYGYSWTAMYSTGKYREGDERKIHPPPWTVCDSFAQAVDLIVASLKDTMS